MALDLLRSAQAILKTDDLTIDNVVFKLHYRVTVAILIGSSLIGVAKQYFGDPINCQVNPAFPKLLGVCRDFRPPQMCLARCWMITAGSTQPSISGQSTRAVWAAC